MSLREKILETAYDLFAEVGYDKTTVAGIIERAGTSKGNFYHHFKSKEDLLEAITLSYIEAVKLNVDEILSDRSLSVLQKFQQFFYKLGDIKRDSVKDWPKLERMYNHAGSHVLLQRFAQAFDRAAFDYYHQLILMGVESGEFAVEYPRELAELWSREVMQFYRKTRKAILGDKEQFEILRNWLVFCERLINQQLGLATSTINLQELGSEYVASIRRELAERGAERG